MSTPRRCAVPGPDINVPGGNAELVGEQEPAAVAAARRYYAGECAFSHVVDALRRTRIYVPTVRRPAPTYPLPSSGGGSWLLVYSTLERLAEAAGHRDHITTSGADLLDSLLPALPIAGVVLDARSAHKVPFERAVITDQATPNAAALPGAEQ